MSRKLKVGFCGCGRMGKLHMANILSSIPEAEIIAVADPMMDKGDGREWCAAHGLTNVSTDPEFVLGNKDVEAVFVCTTTPLHAPTSLAAVKAGKHAFCEKPISYDIAEINALRKAIDEAGVKFMPGFNRRFDRDHKAVADAVKRGDIGQPHIVTVSSRDPEPPTIEYVKVSGGLFYDMMIHDFDMVRYVTGSEAVEISAVGACLIDPDLQKKSGIFDVDTAVVTLKMANGCIATINNSRKAVYGYDQRVEAFGSKGVAQDGNELINTASVMTVDGCRTERPQWFFLERYTQAYVDEAKAFIDSVLNDAPLPCDVLDGLMPVLMAKAATESCKQGGAFVKVEKP